MRRAYWIVLLLPVVLWRGCSCNSRIDGGEGYDGGPDRPDALSGGELAVSPPEVTLDATAGAAGPKQAYTARTRGGQDVSLMATWTLDDPSMGDFTGNTL